MEGLLAILVCAAAGVFAAGAVGYTPRGAGMALAPKLIAGALGGIAAGALLGAVRFVTVEPAPAADAALAASVDWRIAAVQVLGSLIGGGILTAIVDAATRRA